MRVPINAKERAKRPGSVPYYGATGQVGWIDGCLFDEELLLLGEDGAPFLDASKSKTYIVNGPSWVNNHAHVLRASQATTNGYLKYQLDSIDYRQFVNGTTRLKLTQASMRELPVGLAPSAEQERIVAAIEEQFSLLHAAEESLNAARRRLDRFRNQLLAQAASGDWPFVELAKVTDHQMYGSSAKASPEILGVPMLRMGNIANGNIRFDALKFIPADHPDVVKYELHRGDLLFNRTNSPELVGKSAVFTAESRCLFASYLIRLRLTNECDPRWASLVINGPIGREYVAKVRTQQVGQANVNGTKLAAMPIPLPPLAEQLRILAEVDRQLSIVDAMSAELDVALKRSAQLRRAILDRAFRGELVPQDPDDEPASVLLDRIREERAEASKPRGKRTRTPKVAPRSHIS